MRQFERYEPRQQGRWINLANNRLDISEAERQRMQGNNVTIARTLPYQRCPHYPRKRTWEEAHSVMSALGHNQKSNPSCA